MPSITTLMATANRIPGVVTRGPEATRSAALGIHSAAIDARDWLALHPCPESAVGVEFAIAFGEFISLAEECTIASGIPGYDSEDLDERAGRVVADLMLAMYGPRPHETQSTGSPWSGPNLRLREAVSRDQLTANLLPQVPWPCRRTGGKLSQ